MPPKRGQKRKAAPAAATANGTATALSPPNPTNFTDWIEMESEPAFFNVMLREMGVRRVRMQEIYSIEGDMLATLPQPVHGFIFLFRYKTEDEEDHGQTGQGTDHIWFANQVPNNACATIAILNIINNIPGLHMGKQLRNFRHFTEPMTPLNKGYMIDDFAYLRHVHNSFARESDFLNADLLMKGQFDKYKRKAAAAKGRATKEAKKATQRASEKTAPAATKKTKAFARDKKAPKTDAYVTSAKSTPARSTPASPTLAKSTSSARSSARSTPNPTDNGDAEYGFPDKISKREAKTVASESPRRSARAPKPRKDVNAVTVDEEEEGEPAFHFIAYMPIGDHVWKLDGLNYFPIDMGPFGAGKNGTDGGTGNWIDAVSPTIMARLGYLQDGEIQFSLMAVVHDPAVQEKVDLLANVKAIQAVEAKLSDIVEDWREMDETDIKGDVVVGPSSELCISQADIDDTALLEYTEKRIVAEDDILKLIELRQSISSQQARLRTNLRDSLIVIQKEDEDARHARHDYGAFVKSWLGALAETGELTNLLDDV